MPVSTKVPPDLGFEGPEKTLDILFSGSSLRSLPRLFWVEILDLVKAQILSEMHNDHVDAFVLSESSLFVFSDRVLLKTCGTTTLLLALPRLLSGAASNGSLLSGLYYSRKAFYYPKEQVFPHTTWDEEIAFLESIVGDVKTMSVDGVDGWCLAVKDRLPCDQPIIQLMMSRLPPPVCNHFYKLPDEKDLENKPNRMSLALGIDKLDPSALLDDHIFDPCGYSMNSLNGPFYSTIHVTPEQHCSYASFETNASDAHCQIKEVLGMFKPDAFSLALFGGAKVVVDGYEIVRAQHMDAVTFIHYEKRNKVVFDHVLDYHC